MRFRPIFFCLTTGLAAVVACAATNEDPPPSSSTGADRSSPIRTDPLEKLATRLLTTPYHGFPGEPRPKKPMLYPEQLPEGFDLPLPDDVIIVGALVQKNGGFRVVADSNLKPQAILDFYRVEMEKRNWHLPPRQPEMRGFSPAAGFASTFCDPNNVHHSLHILANDYFENSPTDVRINLMVTERHSPCLQKTNRVQRSHMELLPHLKTPIKVTLLSTRSSGGDDGSAGIVLTTSALLETDKHIASLVTHYQQELMNAGWKMYSDEIGTSFATNSWQWQDKDGSSYIGTFVVLENKLRPNQRWVTFEMTGGGRQ